jgi:capsular polysaccharide biosynthesis protein
LDGSITLFPLLKRWWWALALGALIAGAAGYVLASRAAPTYKGEIKLLVGPINADAGELDAAGEIGRTYSELAVSRPVLEAAIKKARARVPADALAKGVSSTSNEISRIVSIGVEHGDPKVAAALAGAIAERLQEISKEGREKESEAVREFMKAAEISALNETDRSEVRAAARREFATSGAGRVTVVDPAREPTTPVGPLVPMMTLLAALAGLLAAGLIVVIRDSSGPTDEGERDLAEFPGELMDANGFATVLTRDKQSGVFGSLKDVSQPAAFGNGRSADETERATRTGGNRK